MEELESLLVEFRVGLEHMLQLLLPLEKIKVCFCFLVGSCLFICLFVGLLVCTKKFLHLSFQNSKLK